MRVTINGSVTKDALKSILETQKEKVKVIDDFCKENKQGSFYYKDSELEYEYERNIKVKPEVR